MSIRTDETELTEAQVQQGNSIPTDLEIPSCTIEDTDRALFNLFDKQLPFVYRHKEGNRRVPVIFASGERFAVLRRKEPLRDKGGAIILPLISIMRTGITQSPTIGAGSAQNLPVTIKKKISSEDPLYQRLVNRQSFKASDDLVSGEARPNWPTAETGSLPGRIATRRGGSKTSMDTQKGRVLETSLGKNIFEIITMPPPKYYTATYEVTFWTQYTQQMNNMLMAMMSLYQSYSQRTFRLETAKGYWFVAYMGDSLTPGNNFDDFTDSERLIRYSFEVTVPAYIVGNVYPGSQNRLRKFYSAPTLSFDADIFNESYVENPPAAVNSGNPESHILDALRTIDGPVPGQAIGTNNASKEIGGTPVAKVGNTTTDSNAQTIELAVDPFTGQRVRRRVFVKSRLRRSGETVLKEDLLGLT